MKQALQERLFKGKGIEAWSDVSLSSLENYARNEKPAPVGPEGPPKAADPELPAWYRAIMRGGGAPGGPPKAPGS